MQDIHTRYLYLLHLADNALILGHRLSEWCGHGPILEQDIAMSNFALDFIGQARSLYQYAAELQGENKSEDDLAYLRDAPDFRNCLLVEVPNGDFAQTIVRQFLYDAYALPFYTALLKSKDHRLVAIAEKTIKEARYHLQWSSEWMLRLGDGTAESKQRAQSALNGIWAFTGELVEETSMEKTLAEEGYIPHMQDIHLQWKETVGAILSEATLALPPDAWMQTGGKSGKHTEYLGYILAEMQFLQRAYPGATW